ncbi:hypothetical protein Micbo1qcDRAFT_178236 [Microdochium bolleyi]|uniref:Uncharacterized protein n=1 Tax=Microdochium bolleyi TaxID=196109 RepID=A0A136IT86_9PEZI|nr:hypothetical protein Micbo1qcDRAFT_178236 [Microdochium bolleyi]
MTARRLLAQSDSLSIDTRLQTTDSRQSAEHVVELQSIKQFFMFCLNGHHKSLQRDSWPNLPDTLFGNIDSIWKPHGSDTMDMIRLMDFIIEGDNFWWQQNRETPISEILHTLGSNENPLVLRNLLSDINGIKAKAKTPRLVSQPLLRSYSGRSALIEISKLTRSPWGAWFLQLWVLSAAISTRKVTEVGGDVLNKGGYEAAINLWKKVLFIWDYLHGVTDVLAEIVDVVSTILVRVNQYWSDKYNNGLSLYLSERWEEFFILHFSRMLRWTKWYMRHILIEPKQRKWINHLLSGTTSLQETLDLICAIITAQTILRRLDAIEPIPDSMFSSGDGRLAMLSM